MSDYVDGDFVAVICIRGAQIPGARLPGRIIFCTVAPDICGSSGWNLLQENPVVPAMKLYWKIKKGGV